MRDAELSAAPLLIVDDNEVNLELASFILLAAGFDVATALDAEQALQSIQARRPRLILMDIQLPGMDGLALTRLLKADPATRDIVVVAFTAYAMAGDETRMLAAGCDAYLSKPIDLASFARQVRALMPVD
jgi:two-component system cell cycle response regulator DivK